jgi:hypothetical protein
VHLAREIHGSRREHAGRHKHRDSPFGEGDEGTEATEEAEEFTDKVKEADAETMFWNEVEMLKKTFLPGMKYSWGPSLVTLAAVTGSIIWFVVYFRYCYQDDRHQDHCALDTIEGSTPRVLDDCGLTIARHLDIRPDLIIVFHHPKFDHEDKDKLADPDNLRRCLVDDKPHEHGKALPEVSSLLHQMHHTVGEADEDGELGQGAINAFHRMSHSVMGGFSGKAHSVSKGQIRESLLRDMYHGLMKWGFDVLVFSSVDYDELFMCVSMHSVETLYHYLAAFHSELQVQRQITERLGIDVAQNEAASSPPYIRFDQRVVEKLYQTKAGRPPYQGVESDDALGIGEERILPDQDPKHLFRVHHGGKHKGGSIVSSLERIHLIFREISNHLDLDAAKEIGYLVDWYPVHTLTLVAKLRESWANLYLMKDFSFVQPVSLLAEYFGSRVAFRFAWSGLYCKALLALLPLAVMCELAAFAAKQWFGEGQVDRMMVASFNVVVIVWSKIAYNLWAREESFFTILWGMGTGHQEQHMARAIRPSFTGTLTHSILDRNLMEKTYPAHKLFLRWLASTFVTLSFCIMVWVLISFWYKLYEGRMTFNVVVVVSLQIKIFEYIWNTIAPKLAEFENHKHQNDYYDSYLWKHFLFQAVNSYCAYFYIAMNLRFTPRGCPPGGCLKALRQQLMIIQVIISVSSVVDLAWKAYKVEFHLYLEMFQLRRSQGNTLWQEFKRLFSSGDDAPVGPGPVPPPTVSQSTMDSPRAKPKRAGIKTDDLLRSPPQSPLSPQMKAGDDEVEAGMETDESENLPVRSYAEEQSKHAEFRVRQQIEAMCMLVISLGYVLIFGAVAPIMVPFCFMVFVLELRFTALMLTTLTKRTVPRGQLGIGAWKNVIMFIMKMGVAFSGFLLVTYGDTFSEAKLLAKISAAVGFCLLMVLFWEIVDIFLPSTDNEVYKLNSRRTHVEHRIRQACKHEAPRSLSEHHVDPHGAIATAFKEMRYEDVPPLDHFPTRDLVMTASSQPEPTVYPTSARSR